MIQSSKVQMLGLCPRGGEGGLKFRVDRRISLKHASSNRSLGAKEISTSLNYTDQSNCDSSLGK